MDGDTVNTASSTDYTETQPWWKVQLAYPVWVTQVEITNHDFNKGEYLNTIISIISLNREMTWKYLKLMTPG